MKEDIVSQYYAKDKTRKAILARDNVQLPHDKVEKRYIVRMYTIDESQNLSLWGTRLIYDHALRYAEDLCENFVDGYGEFRELNGGESNG